jgi:cytochrome P450
MLSKRIFRVVMVSLHLPYDYQQTLIWNTEWTEINVVDILTKIVARVSSRMFGGKTLSRNKKWVAASIAFAIDGFHGAQKLKKVPFEFLKPFAARFIPEIRRIKEYYKTAEKAAIPLLNSREEKGDRALDLLYWMSEQAKGYEKDKRFIAGILLKVSFAAIHTSAAAPSQLIFDLCEMPQYIEPLREEIRNAMGPDNHIDKKGFLQMSKMDSIMKESQRFSPLLLSKLSESNFVNSVTVQTFLTKFNEQSHSSVLSRKTTTSLTDL